MENSGGNGISSRDKKMNSLRAVFVNKVNVLVNKVNVLVNKVNVHVNKVNMCVNKMNESKIYLTGGKKFLEKKFSVFRCIAMITWLVLHYHINL